MLIRNDLGALAVAASQNKKERDYWLNQLAGEPELCHFPYDFEKEKDNGIDFNTHSFQLDEDISTKLIDMSKNNNHLLFVILVSGVVCLLHRYTGKTDIIVGMPIYEQAGELNFINTVVALRSRITREINFKEFLQLERQVINEAVENQDYPIEILSEKLNRPFSHKHQPLFDCMVMLENIQDREYIQTIIDHINILFLFDRKGENIECKVLFDVSLYKESTINRIALNLRTLLKAALFKPDKSLSGLELLADPEKTQLLYDFNRLSSDYPIVDTIHGLFEEQVEKNPHKIAVKFKDGHCSYDELNRRANRLAAILKNKGVKQDTIVGIMVERSFDMIIGIIGILKAGGAYLPIDCSYPLKRITYMLKQSKVKFVLTTSEHIKKHSFTDLLDLQSIIVEPHLTPPRSPADFDSFPIPNRSFVNYDHYRDFIGHAMVKHSISIQPTRGCPFRCAYCHRIWPRSHTFRSAENLYAEIELYYRMGVRRFVIIDDIFNFNVKNSSQFFRLILKNKLTLHLFFPNGMRGDLLTKDYIDLMVEAGTVNLDLALETASPRLQKLIGKNLNLNKLRENLDYLCSRYPQVVIDLGMMIGFPTETEEEALMTLDYLKSIHWVHFPYPFILKIHPNTEIGRIARENGISEKAIARSMNQSYHDIPETLPFPGSFVREYIARFTNEYFFLKERLLNVLPNQMKMASEDELIQKYNNYLPTTICSINDVLELANISGDELSDIKFLDETYSFVPDLNTKIGNHFTERRAGKEALKILLLDISELFSSEAQDILHGEISEPLGLMYLQTYIEEKFSDRVCGKIAKSRVDFDSYGELKKLVEHFRPDIIGIRSLSYYKDFFHQTVIKIKEWRRDVPIIAGGPYATMDYKTILQDPNVDIVVLREGEVTFAELVGEILNHGKKLPPDNILEQIQGISFIRDKDKSRLEKESREFIRLDRIGDRLSRQPDTNPVNINRPDDLLYAIYTSGSTGNPKGVTLEHKNLLNLLLFQECSTNLDFSSILQFTTISFDVATQEIFSALLAGGTLHLIDNEIRTNIPRFFQFIKNQDIKTMFLPVTFLKLIFTEKEFSGRVPGCIKHLVLAGEQLVVNMNLKNYLKKNKVYLHNHYGPSETHVVTTFTMNPGDELPEFPPIGKPITNTRIYICDPSGCLAPLGVQGELYIGGLSVGRGYLGDEGTKTIRPGGFVNNPFITGERLYRTGDLARWLPDGNIEFLGRLDSQVKIRGFRVELGEIELNLSNYQGIKNAAVILRERDGSKTLCAYFVTDGRDVNPLELKKHLEDELPEYMIPVHFIRLREIPVTPTGKVDRKALLNSEVETTAEYTAPGNETEKQLVKIWREILGLENVGVNDNFFKLGGHSLRATILISRVQREFDIELSISEVFKRPTIRELALFVQKSEKSIYEEIKAVEKKEYYPLSSAQKRLFILDRFEDIGVSYNMPSLYKIEEEFDNERFENAIRKMIRQHQAFRTSFEIIMENPVQRVHDQVDFHIRDIHLRETANENENINDAIKRLIAPFDLGQAPLLRAAVVHLSGEERFFFFDIHHIISDGTSMGILISDFSSLLSGAELTPLRIQYKDFSYWQNGLFESGKIKRQIDYWLGIFSENIPRLDFPSDYERPAVFTYKGGFFSLKLDPSDSGRFCRLYENTGTTLFMNMLAVLNILFYKYTAREDIVIGSSIMGRPDANLQGIIGMFVNELAMRSFPQGDKTYLEFLAEVKEHSIQALKNQDLQFEELVDLLNLYRDTSRNPLFDVCLAVNNFERAAKEVEGFSPFGYDWKSSKFDITFFVTESGDEISFSIEYYKSIFRTATVERLAGHLINIIRQVGNNPGIAISGISLLTEEEKENLLIRLNDTAAEYPRPKTVHRLFEEQVEKTPDFTAVVYESRVLSYRCLNEKADQVGNYLYLEKFIRVDERVGILLDRSIDLLIGILGILKAGGAYVPIDSSLPENRIKYIIEDAGIEIMISGKKHIRLLNRLQWECKSFDTFLCIDSLDVYDEEEAEKSELMNQKLWDYVGEKAIDEITGGGWVSGYTGEPFSKKEMDEYGDNILMKLLPLLHKGMRVLEIGCASGITMYRIAPRVGFYYGIDLSEVIITRNIKRIKEEGQRNISLTCMAAHDIDQLEERDFDLIIINSVIQSFHGHNYLRKIVGKSIDLLKKKGYLFIGDVMDQDSKQALIEELRLFGEAGKGKNHTTKTDWSTELFVSRAFFEDLPVEFPGIRDIKFSNKIYTVENELTRFRYDVVLTVIKDKQIEETGRREYKYKYQEDRRAIEKYGESLNETGVASFHLAYVIYTSGTTGKPKGVMIDHRSLLNYISWGIKQYINGIHIGFPLYTNISFDLTVTSVFIPLLTGNMIVIYGEDKDRLTILKVIKENLVQCIKATPSHLKMIQNETLQGAAALKELIVGGEELALDPARDIYNKFSGKVEIYNEYGPTETAVGCVFYKFDSSREEGRTVPIGRPIDNVRIYVLDKNLQSLPPNAIGEIYIAGDSLARGYINNPELSGAFFIEGNFIDPGTGQKRTTAAGRRERLYKTGDLGRWLYDGNLEFIGRVDDQVKIRGFRIETGDIENRLRSVEEIADVLVSIKQDETGGNYLCAYYVSAEEIGAVDLRGRLSKELPDYMVPSFFIRLEKMPLTPNGKIDRRNLPEPLDAVELKGYSAPTDILEIKLAKTWAEVLGIAKDQIGIDMNFFELGGHSLKATILTAKIHKELDVKIPLAEVFNTPTIRGLSSYIKEKSKKERFESIKPLEKKEYYELSSAQKRLFILHNLEKESTAYNMPGLIQLAGDMDPGKVEPVIRELIARHDCLRSSFEVFGGEPVQRVLSRVEFKIEQSTDHFLNIDNFIRPFDLSRAPLLRVGIFKTGNEENLLLVDMHHIICDGTSHDILRNEFLAIYAGEELGELRLDYADYSGWQKKSVCRELIRQQEQFWLDIFRGELPLLNLPADYSRPLMQSFAGATISFSLGREETEKLGILAGECDATLYMVVLSVFYILLAKLSGREDIVVGTSVSNRRHADLEKIIGMFVNTIALRNLVPGDQTFKDFLSSVKKGTLKAYDNQDYQFEDLVEKLSPARNTGRNPVFDVMLNWINREEETGEAPEITGDEGLKHKKGISKFDLTLHGLAAGKRLLLGVEYCTKLFSKDTIELFIGQFKDILSSVLENPDKKIWEIKKMPRGKQDRLLADLRTGLENEVEKISLEGSTIQEKLNDSFVIFKDRIAVYSGETAVSYDGLLGRSNRLVARMFARGIKKQTIIGILSEDRLEIVTAIVGILRAACIIMPLDPAYPEDRLNILIKQSAVKYILIDRRSYDRLCGSCGSHHDGVEFVFIDDVFAGGQDAGAVKETGMKDDYSGEDSIYIYFTSGTTGRPHAILGKNKSLVQFIDWEVKTFAVDKRTRVSQLITPGFDAFLRDMFVPLCSGGALCIPPDKETLLDPVKLPEWLERSGIHIIHCVPGLFRTFIGSMTKNRLKELRFILLSGEKINPADLEEWYKTNHDKIRLINLYGPTETTMTRTFYPISADDSKRERVPVGLPIPGTRILVLDDRMGLCDRLVSGEIYIRTPFATCGYCNDGELNKEKFIPDPVTGNSGYLLYRTGDQGRILADGNLDLLGRNDRQVKIRGNRVELEELENLLLKNPAVAEAAVVKSNIDHNEMLCAFITGSDETEVDDIALLDDLKKYLSARLPAFMVPARFVKLAEIPRKANGKTDYGLLEGWSGLEEKAHEALQDNTEVRLMETWREILGIEEIGRFARRVSFFELGGNSLNVMALISRIHKKFDTRISLGVIFNNPTIEQQAMIINAAEKESYIPIRAVEAREYYSLSSAQKRLFVLNRMEENGTVYNMINVFPIIGDLNLVEIEAAFKKLIARHESLRTSFVMVNEEPVQRIHKPGDMEFKIEYCQTGRSRLLYESQNARIGSRRRDQNDIPDIIAEFSRPFDLSKAPLLRVGLINKPGQGYFLIVDMHHIISDGTSHGILEKEFFSLYSGEELAPLKLDYKDYAEWQNSSVQQEILKRQESYWLELYSDELQVLDLPCDFSRPVMQSYAGAKVNFAIPAAETEKLKKIAGETGATLYMVLLAVFKVFLAKLSACEDIVVGTPTAGRRHADLANITGMFVNTLALRSHIDRNYSFKEFVNDVKEHTLQAFENQEFQFEDLVEKIRMERDTSRNPIFDVMFNLLNQAEFPGDIPVGKTGSFNHRKGTSKFDMNMTAVEMAGKLYFDLEYCTDLFTPATIERFIGYFVKILLSVSADCTQKIGSLELLDSGETKAVLRLSRGKDVEITSEQTVHRLFEQVVRSKPQAVALVFDDRMITYGELNKQANRLAAVLRKRKAAADNVVGLMIERSLEMVIGIIAILKAGAACLPIDPEYPEERKKFMITDSNITLLLTGRETGKCFAEIPENVEVLNIKDKNLYRGKGGNLHHINRGADLFYIIYTSGSTGTPKGVMLEHRSIVNLIKYDQLYTNIDCSSILQFHTICFDASFHEIFCALLSGGTLFLAEKDTLENINKLLKLIGVHKIKTLFLPMSMLRLIFDEEGDTDIMPHCVKHIQTAGERVVVSDKLRKHLIGKGVYLHNHYGPSETHVITALTVDPGGEVPEFPSIGRPITNTGIYILDKEDHLLPPGIPGQLCAAGMQVGRGYWGLEQQTEEKFTANPFKKGERLYKTGDLARWRPDGNIEFIGRIDDQVKIRGFRVEPGEIEAHLLNRKNVKEVVVTVRAEVTGAKYLAAYFTANEEIEPLVLREYLSERLPNYMIPSYFVRLEEFPLTRSGKIDRRSLPAPQTAAGSEFAVPGNEVEEILVNIWKKTLSREKVGINDNFFVSGGDSIKAIQIASRMKKEGYKLDVRYVFRYPTIAELSPHIKKSERIADQGMVTGDIPLTPIQEDFFSTYKIAPHHYNQSMMLRLETGFDKECITAIFKKIREHHDALRMTYCKNKKIVQTCRGFDYPFSLTEYDYKGCDNAPGLMAAGTDEIQAGINLEQGPLMKLGLFHSDDGDYLLIVIHHLVIDGVSWRILFEDIELLYQQYKEGSPLELPLKTDSFKIWAEKLLEYAGSETFLREKDYWRKIETQLYPEIKKDFEGKKNREKDITAVSFTLNETETNDLLTKVNYPFGTEINDILLTALGLAIKKMYGQNRVLVALEGHGRESILNDLDINRTVGWFTSIYPVVLDMSHDKNLSRQIKDVKEGLRRIPNKGIGYGILKYLTPEEDKNDIRFKLNPQIHFNYLGSFDEDVKGRPFTVLDSTGTNISPNETRKYELYFSGMISENKLLMYIIYSKEQYKSLTIETLMKYFKENLLFIISYCSQLDKKEITPADFGLTELSLDELDTIFE